MKKSLKIIALILLCLAYVLFAIVTLGAALSSENVTLIVCTAFLVGMIFSSIVLLFVTVVDNAIDHKRAPKAKAMQYKVVKVLDKYTIASVDASIDYPMFDNKEEAFAFRDEMNKSALEAEE